MLALIEAIEWNPLRWAIETRMRLAVLLLRLYAGGAMAWVGYQQWEDPAFAINLPSLLMGWAHQNPFFFYEDILRYIATPNAHIVAWVLPILEMTVGGLLIAGLFARWATAAFIFLAFNFYLATQHTGTAAAGLNVAFMAIGLVLLFAESGEALGLDQLVFKIALHFGWVKPVRRKKKRRLAPPKPLKSLPPKLKEIRMKEAPERVERVEKGRASLTSARALENSLGDTIRKLKERQQQKAAAKPVKNAHLKRYDPDELDDDDDEDEDDIYAYHGDDDDDDDD